MRPLSIDNACSQATNAEGCHCITSKQKVMKKNFRIWMAKNNMVFSAIAGETFTNAQVVYTHIGLLAFFAILGLFGK